MTHVTDKKFLTPFDQTHPIPDTPPIWLMRQAGRYLNEYRATRLQAGRFLDLCYNPELATEVTLQPIRRYGFDASILFADILLIPQALGQKLWFVEGEGPRLEPIFNADSLHLNHIHDTLSPVYQTVKNLSKALPKETALIGFAGSPWTVATYMIAGQGTADQAPAHALYKSDRAAFDSIIDVLIEATTDYLARQVEAGAECLQLFDSWAASLTRNELERYCFAPNAQIIKNLRARDITVPIIGFPRGVGEAVRDFVETVPVQAVSIDQNMDMVDAVNLVPENIVLQGNLNPLDLVAGGLQLNNAIDKILSITEGRRHIFNLGHGIVPQTPPENVAQLVNHLRGNTSL